jgi:hypothetical protein
VSNKYFLEDKPTCLLLQTEVFFDKMKLSCMYFIQNTEIQQNCILHMTKPKCQKIHFSTENTQHKYERTVHCPHCIHTVQSDKDHCTENGV